MELTAENRLRKLIVVGDRLLIRPKKQPDKTDSGLYLPPGVQEKEKVQTGFVIKVGPGYPIPMATDEDEPWKKMMKKSSMYRYKLKKEILLFSFRKEL